MNIFVAAAALPLLAALLLICHPSDAFAPAACTVTLSKPVSQSNNDLTSHRRNRWPALSASKSSVWPFSKGLSLGSKTSPSLNGSSNRSVQGNSNALSKSPRQLTLYNSLTRAKAPFVPLSPPFVSLYTCGPTVYDYAHVGNFRAFLTYDVLKRVLLYLGYDVDHVCNLTDVDDKIIKRCERDGTTLLELTRKFEAKFFDDLDALNIVRAGAYPRATDNVIEMARLIVDLERNGLAYQSSEGSWYFSVSKKEGYGTRLVQLHPEQLKKGASAETGGGGAQRGGMDADEYDAEKEGVQDFCLWKAFKPDFDREDAAWDPVVELEGGETMHIGRGRPGWHLECSAMARKYLGNTIDLHAGGVDLKFPHHENEIAQSEGANCAPFCHCWVHNGFVNIGDEKMSKSKGNFLTLRGACPTSDDVRAYRYLIVSSQYRNPLSFTDAALSAAKGALKRLDRVRDMIADALLKGKNVAGGSDEGDSDIAVIVEKELTKFDVAIADDLSMPRASASLFSIVKAAEREFKRVSKARKDFGDDEISVIPPLDLTGLKRVQHALDKMDCIFGIYYDVPKTKGEDSGIGNSISEGKGRIAVPANVMDLVVQRIAAKDSKDWELADSLRTQINALGFLVKDTKGRDPIITKV